MELLSNNAVDYFKKIYVDKEQVCYLGDQPINSNRYHILSFKKEGNIKKVFFKYVEKPYLSAERGFSESINREHFKDITALFNQWVLDYCYICYKDGNIYKISPATILKEKNHHFETDCEGKEKYIFNIKLMERYNG